MGKINWFICHLCIIS